LYYAENTTRPDVPAQTNITGTSAVISGLVNDTPYYVWVEAVNSGGTSTSATKTMTLHLPAPSPVLSAGNGSITVQWQAITLAASYNLYYSTSETRPADPARPGITGTSAVISGLVNNTPYYVWVEAVNERGTSMSEAVTGTPRYVWEVDSAGAFNTAVAAINAATVAGNYTIDLTQDIAVSNIVFNAAGVAKTITIIGNIFDRDSLINNGNSDLVTVRANNTLVLIGIWLNGNEKEYHVISVDGGALVMKEGSVVSNAKDSGVRVNSGTFTMESGTISGNTASSGGGVYVAGGTFTMKGGAIIENTASSSRRGSGFGGGVYVYGGTFIKNGGGAIKWNTARVGYVAYVSSGQKQRDTNAESEVNMNSDVAGLAGGWE
jgi:hypothetical protein